jgi:hypothetical protein
MPSTRGSAARVWPKRTLTASVETRSASPRASSAEAAPAAGPARSATMLPALTNAERERVPCGLAPHVALRTPSWQIASGPLCWRDPLPKRLRKPASRLLASAGCASSPYERPRESGPASGHSPLRSASSVSHTAVQSARRGRGELPPSTIPRGPLNRSAARRLERPLVERVRTENSAGAGNRLGAVPSALQVHPAQCQPLTTYTMSVPTFKMFFILVQSPGPRCSCSPKTVRFFPLFSPAIFPRDFHP